MFINPFENATTQILKDFCEEYIRLAELITLFDKDAWDMIDRAENDVKKRFLMCEKTAFPNEKAASIHFMKLRVSLITKNINGSNAVKQAQERLSRFLREHSYEVRELGLSFRNKTLLSPSEIYANYYYLVQKLPGMVIPEPYSRKK